MNIYQYCREYLKEKSDPYKVFVILVVLLLGLFFYLYLWSHVPVIALLIMVALGFLVRFIGKSLQEEQVAQAERERLKAQALEEMKNATAFGEILEVELLKEQKTSNENADEHLSAEAVDIEIMRDTHRADEQ
ncbi:hypothetical protein V6615_10285 [Oscillospiraceae bacterium PP1C4]